MKRHAKESDDSGSVMRSGCREVGFASRKVRRDKKNSDANLRNQGKDKRHRNESWVNLPLYCGYFLQRRMATCEAMKPDEIEMVG